MPSIAQTDDESVIVVSRTRILTETVAAQSLRKDEAELRGKLKAWIDSRKVNLEAEEQKLTMLRSELAKPEFEIMTEEFDQQVRRFRRDTQRYDAAIQAGFREARKSLLQALYPILIEILLQRGASVIIDSDQILIADPRIDMTDEVIALYDDRVGPLVLDEIDLPVVDSVEVPNGEELPSE